MQPKSPVLERQFFVADSGERSAFGVHQDPLKPVILPPNAAAPFGEATVGQFCRGRVVRLRQAQSVYFSSSSKK